MVKISTSQMSDIILDACMKFQNYPIKTVGGDAFYSYFILYHYFKNFKNSPKIQKIVRSSKKENTSQVGDIILDTCIKFGSYPTKTVVGDRFWKIVLRADRRLDL